MLATGPHNIACAVNDPPDARAAHHRHLAAPVEPDMKGCIWPKSARATRSRASVKVATGFRGRIGKRQQMPLAIAMD